MSQLMIDDFHYMGSVKFSSLAPKECFRYNDELFMCVVGIGSNNAVNLHYGSLVEFEQEDLVTLVDAVLTVTNPGV